MRVRLAAVLLMLAAAGGAAFAAAPKSTERLAARSRCSVRPTRLSYHWPVKPFDEPHPIRGNFGDPRTIFHVHGGGSFTFHNGVDIVAPDWTPVYPVVSGVVRYAHGDGVIVESPGERAFQYWHVLALVATGEHVVADKTVLGLIRPQWHHVHLSEIRYGVVANPLAPGHLMPYNDRTAPVVGGVVFQSPDGAPLDPTALKGSVQIVASATDTPALPNPGPWNGLPVTPAQISWRLTTEDGTVVLPDRLAVDFLGSEPPNEEFWQVYAHGSYQNFATMGKHYMFGLHGKYLFHLTSRPLDTDALPPGDYVLTVSASDICGNTGTLSEPVVIAPHPAPPEPVLPPAPTPTPPPATVKPVPIPPAPAQRALFGWPHGKTAYTVVLASVPEREGTRMAMHAAHGALGKGLPSIGLLRSARYQGLRAGYWVVFSGAYPTLAYAQAAAQRAARLYPDAFPRLIDSGEALQHWPKARAAYTIVLRSLPMAAGLAAAREEASHEQSLGLKHVGVLASSRFGTLQAGYFVIFSGSYRSLKEASRVLGNIVAPRAPGAYVREIRR